MRALALLAMVGCLEADAPSPLIPPSCASSFFFESYGRSLLDILFVIDDSPEMAPYLAALETNAPVFMNILESLPDGGPDIHIAVAAASTGALVDPVPCGAQAGARFLAMNHSLQNFTGALPDVFSCLAHVGTNASLPQQPLAATTAALSANRDFMRVDAELAVIVITPNDDASPEDPAAYVAALRALEPIPNRVIVSAITRTASTRLHSFVDGFGSLGLFVSIDLSSWVDAFDVVGNVIGRVLGRQCIGLVLTQPISCTFTRIQYLGTPMQKQLGTLPLCDPAGQPRGACAVIVPDAACTVSGLKQVFCYNGFDPTNPTQPCPSGRNYPADGETVITECAVKCGP